ERAAAFEEQPFIGGQAESELEIRVELDAAEDVAEKAVRVVERHMQLAAADAAADRDRAGGCAAAAGEASADLDDQLADLEAAAVRLPEQQVLRRRLRAVGRHAQLEAAGDGLRRVAGRQRKLRRRLNRQ